MDKPKVGELREWIKESREYLDKIEKLLDKKCCHLESEDSLPDSVFTDDEGEIVVAPAPFVAKGSCRVVFPHYPNPWP